MPAHLEDAATRLGQARFWAVWERHAYLGKEMVALEITKALEVRVVYESPEWPEEARRRKRLVPSDL